MKILPYLISFGCKIHQIIEKFKESLKNVQKMKKKCIIKVVTGIGNQGQLPWLATLVTKVTTLVGYAASVTKVGYGNHRSNHHSNHRSNHCSNQGS